MSVLMKKRNEKSNVMFIKGAPDYLLEASKKTINKEG